MAVTLKDIAERVGVTPAAVSMVLNNKPNIGEETRRKVLQVARELNYYPHAIARGLVTKKTEAVGIVIPNMSHCLLSQMLCGIEREIQRFDYRMVLFDLAGCAEADPRMPQRIIQEKRVDGLIVSGAEMSDEELREFVSERLPCVVLEKETDLASCVWADDVAGLRQATSYLLGKGRRRIALIHGPRQKQMNAFCIQGYREALTEAGIALDETLQLEAEASEISEGKKAAERLLARKTEVDAVVSATGDMAAIGTMKHFKRRGIRVPEDVAVIGYGDLRAAEAAEPELTTVRQPLSEMGAEAVKILMRKIQGEARKLTKKKFQTELIVRESA